MQSVFLHTFSMDSHTLEFMPYLTAVLKENINTRKENVTEIDRQNYFSDLFRFYFQ